MNAGYGYLNSVKPAYYSFFISSFRFSTNPWVWVITQAIIASVTLLYVMKKLHVDLAWKNFILILFGVFISPLAVITSYLMPDFIAGELVLLIFVFCFLNIKSKIEYSTVLIFITLICSIHLTFIALAIVISITLLLYAILTKVTAENFKIKCVSVLVAAILSATSIVIFNARKFESIEVSQSTWRYLFARSYSDNLLDNYLSKHCSQTTSAICQNYINLPKNSDWILWSRQSFLRVSRQDYRQMESELRMVVIAAFFESPFQFIKTFFRNGISQVLNIETSEVFALRNPARVWHIDIRRKIFSPELQEQFYHSLQAASTVFTKKIEYIFYVTYLSPLLYFIVILSFRNCRIIDRQLIFVCILGILINAFLCGGISGQFGRYQLRLAWLPLFISMTIYFRKRVQ